MVCNCGNIIDSEIYNKKYKYHVKDIGIDGRYRSDYININSHGVVELDDKKN